MEPDESDDLKLVDESIQIVDTFLDDLQRRQDAIPSVTDAREQLCLMRDILSNVPPEFGALSKLRLRPVLTDTRNALGSALATNQPFGFTVPIYVGTATTTGAIAVFDSVVSAAYSQQPRIGEFERQTVRRVREQQAKQRRLEKARSAINALGDANLDERMERAEKAYTTLTQGLTTRTAAGNEIRNLLYGIKSAACQAICEPDDIGKVKWELIAERLAPGGSGSSVHTTLVRQGVIYDSLHRRLSESAKDFEGETPVDFEIVWAEIIGHAEVMAELILNHKAQPQH